MTKHKPSDVVTVGGQTKSLAEFAAELGTPVQTILSRLKRGMSLDEAVKAPLSKRGGANKGKRLDTDVLVGDEVLRLLDSGNKSKTWVRDRALIVLAYRSGLRCTEILNLLPKDVDVTRGTVSVHHGKGDKARVVALDPEAWAQIAEWIQLRSTWSIDGSSPFFCTQAGTRINDRQVRAMFNRRGARAKLDKHVHPHAMRHTMASELSAEGVPLLDISTILGHANVATTNTYLQKINPSSALNAMRARGWSGSSATTIQSTSTKVPPPGWLPRLIEDIGDRLTFVHDGRKSETEFKAFVVLF